VLHVDAVGRADDFYALGGDSLAVEEMLARVEEAFGSSLLASDFTRATTFADFAGLLDRASTSRRGAPWPATVVEMRPGGSGRPVFCIAGAAQSSVAFVPFTALLDTDDPVVVLQTRGFERHAPAQWSVRAMVRTRLAAIRRLQPVGPYVIVGHSLGAMLALEIGRRLEEQGERVRAVILDPMFVGSAATGSAGQSFVDFMVDPMYIGAGRRGRAVQAVKAVARAALLPVTGLVPARVEARHKLAFRQAGLVAHWHRPRPWAAPMLAYRTADNADPAGLWERLMPNATVHDVPSDHNSLLRTPYIEAVVADLQAWLTDAGAGGAQNG
jgi:thioesterase domain-containing protein